MEEVSRDFYSCPLLSTQYTIIGIEKSRDAGCGATLAGQHQGCHARGRFLCSGRINHKISTIEIKAARKRTRNMIARKSVSFVSPHIRSTYKIQIAVRAHQVRNAFMMAAKASVVQRRQSLVIYIVHILRQKQRRRSHGECVSLVRRRKHRLQKADSFSLHMHPPCLPGHSADKQHAHERYKEAD